MGQRIAILVQKYAHGKNTEFASLIDTNEGNIRGYIKGVLPKSDILARIVTSCDNISATWLLTGEGNMLVNQQDQAPVSQKNDEAVNNSLLQMMMEKDKLLLAQAEEIGRLKAELERMKRIADTAASAPSAHAV